MNNNLNKNISVWRGDSTPPTDKEHIDRAIYNISTLEIGTDQINYKIDHNNGNYDRSCH